MLLLQMPNVFHRSVLHLESQLEVDLAPCSHTPLATENVGNKRRSYSLPPCPGRGQNLGTPLWEDYQPSVLGSPYECFNWTAYYLTAMGSPFSQNDQTDT